MHSEKSALEAPEKTRLGTRILIIDDNRDFAENIAEAVTDLGHAAQVAFTGKEALELFVSRSFDVAIIDLQLPDMFGTRLIARFKEIHPDCICIVFTGNATLSNAVDALNRGAFAYLMKGGEVEEFRAVLRQAIEVHRTSVELKQIRGINQSIMESFPGRLVVLDEEGRVLYTNGYPLPGIPPSPDLDSRDTPRLSEIFPPGNPISDAILAQVPSQGDGLDPWVIPRIESGDRQDGRGWFRIQFVPLFHSVARFLVLVEDISRAVRMEEQMERSSRLAALGELSAMIAHEVRNPLSGISGAIQVLRKKFPAGEEAHEICAQVIGQVDRLNRTIEEILILARPMIPKLTEISPRDLVDSMVLFLREDPKFSEVEFEVQVNGGNQRCLLDPFLLRQALLNVLINASHAMAGKGRILVVIQAIRAPEGPGWVEVRIQDSGPGFSGEAAKLFEPFYTTKSGGTGLGLPITAKILEVHGGSVGLRNLEGGGAEVTFNLPVSPPVH